MTDNSSRFSKDYKAAKTSKSKPTEKGTVIYDPRGQWDYPGQITKIPGGNITMQDVNYPVLGIDNFGNQQMMYPGMDYTFPNADNVTEYPQMKRGGMPYKYTSQNIKTSINSLFTRNEMLFGPSGKHLFKPKMQTGGWLDKYQEGGGTLPKNDATHYYTNDINDYAKRTRAYADSLNINLINNRQLDNSSLVNTNFSSRNPLYNEYKPTQQIMPLQPKPQVKVEPKPVAYQPIVNKPITKQEPKPIPSVSEIVKQPIIPVKPKEEVKSTGGYGTTQDKTGRTYYYFDDKSGRRNWLTEDDYTRKIMH